MYVVVGVVRVSGLSLDDRLVRGGPPTPSFGSIQKLCDGCRPSGQAAVVTVLTLSVTLHVPVLSPLWFNEH